MRSLLCKLRQLFDDIAPGPETRARNEAHAFQTACCGLYLEVARLDSARADRKREAVAVAIRGQFSLSPEDASTMIETLERRENRLTSYFRPVKLINRTLSPGQKVRIVEELWRIAQADGEIDMYEDEVVRKVSDLLYVAHADFILAKHRVQDAGNAADVAQACRA